MSRRWTRKLSDRAWLSIGVAIMGVGLQVVGMSVPAAGAAALVILALWVLP
jgi:hypothetical protein